MSISGETSLPAFFYAPDLPLDAAQGLSKKPGTPAGQPQR